MRFQRFGFFRILNSTHDPKQTHTYFWPAACPGQRVLLLHLVPRSGTSWGEGFVGRKRRGLIHQNSLWLVVLFWKTHERRNGSYCADSKVKFWTKVQKVIHDLFSSFWKFTAWFLISYWIYKSSENNEKCSSRFPRNHADVYKLLVSTKQLKILTYEKLMFGIFAS